MSAGPVITPELDVASPTEQRPLPRSRVPRAAVLRYSARDALLLALAGVHGALLIAFPSAPVIAVALWWTANTVAHNFIHHPFFRARAANAAFSVYLSLLMGLPQTLWRDRHMAHHADRVWRMRWSSQMFVELLAVALVWTWWASHGSWFFLTTWLPGWGCGLILCHLQGYFEHARGTVSHYGAPYNFLLFNDGYHVEHHARPGLHWTELPGHARADAARSSWPAVLRWLELAQLNTLERIVLHSSVLQKFVVGAHVRAFRRLLNGNTIASVGRVTIVGGALFPRTALVMRHLVPNAEITIVDRSAPNIANARAMLGDKVRFVEASWSASQCHDADLVVFPLAFDGEKEQLYIHPPAPIAIVHDWIWRKRGEGVVVSILLLKRLNFVRR